MLLIKTVTLTPLLWLLSFLPIKWLRCLGSLIGRLGLKFAPKAKKRLYNNLLITNIANSKNVDKLAKQTAGELGKTLIESICIAWPKSKNYCYKLIKKWEGLDDVLHAESKGKSIIFLTPHMGNFEISIKASAFILKKNINVLYKPPKDKWFYNLMKAGRAENNIVLLPTTRNGVAGLVKAIKRDEHLGILPDSVASMGDGSWVNFFGNQIFATTLAAKMVLKNKTTTYIAGSYRIKDGFTMEFIPYIPSSSDINQTMQEIYDIIENIIRKYPTQYFWSYDRFRTPSHAKKDKKL